MSEFSIRSESVDVEQIMKQIRQRILEKRGQDYTEDQIRELASVRLEKFLDPKNLRSDLLDQFRKSRPAVPSADIEPPKILPPYAFDDQTLFTSHRGLMRLARKLLNPILKLFFNSNTLNQVLHAQAQFNVDMLKREARRSVEQRSAERAHAIARGEWNALYYEVLHNMVLETTRMGIEVQNQRMKLESLSSRLDFSERRVRALEGVVQYRPEAVRGNDRDDERSAQVAPAAPGAQGAASGFEGFVPGSGGQQGPGQGDGSGRRRRRRRRGRRGGLNQGAEGALGASGASGASGAFGGGAEGTQGPQGDLGGPDDGFEDNEGDENGEELEPMDAGAEAQETLDAIGRAIEAPQAPQEPQAPEAPEASAFAPENTEELRRDKPSSDDEQQ